MRRISGVNLTIWAMPHAPSTTTIRPSRPRCVRGFAEKSARVWETSCLTRSSQIFPPQLVTGLALVEPPAQEEGEQLPTHAQVVRDLALDLQLALARNGRAPFVLSGLPMFEDLCAIRQTLKQCLTLRENPHLHHWETVLDQTWPACQAAFDEVAQALAWVNGIREILDVPLPTAAASGPGGDAVALSLAHHLGQQAHISDLTPWLTQFRDDLFALSERYWSGLFHCYDIAGLPPTNGYTSYCTSFVSSGINFVSGKRRRSASFRPWSLVGASGPGGSNR